MSLHLHGSPEIAQQIGRKIAIEGGIEKERKMDKRESHTSMRNASQTAIILPCCKIMDSTIETERVVLVCLCMSKWLAL